VTTKKGRQKIEGQLL